VSTRYPFPAVPDGWFSVGASEDVGVGEVATVHYLDRELVAFRGEGGRVRVFDAHCPHLGAHLGFGGRVCDDDIVCPFHGWRFDGDGRVVEVPRLDRPPRVSARAWDVRELNGRIFVWYHAAGEPPSYDVMPYCDDGTSWTPWQVNTYRVRIHLQDLTENIIDRSHFYEVHDMLPPEDDRYEVSFKDTTMIVDQSIKITAVAQEGIEVATRTTVAGPGIVAVEVREGPLDMLTYITQTPVDAETVEITILFSMRALDDETATASIADLNARLTNEQFLQDIPIWENKIYREKPPLTRADGPILAYRRWFRQFYSTWESVGVEEES
jgi:phenylpropionate dioxygenase-like ring-hydroxylating dioxygenase large terminal subunit